MAPPLQTLERRYLRLLHFDRFLSLFYAITACFPLYGLLSSGFARAFHLTGVIVIVSCGAGGYLVSTRVVRGQLRSEAPPYFITSFTIVSRLGLMAWGSWLSFGRVMAEFGAESSHYAILDVLPRLLLSPFIVTVVLIAVFYRALYHVSVHYLIMIRSVNQPNQLLVDTRAETVQEK